MNSLMSYNCPLCSDFLAREFHQLLSRVQLVHSQRPGFRVTCGVDECKREFTSMKTYRNHLYGCHMINHGHGSINYNANSPGVILDLSCNNWQPELQSQCSTTQQISIPQP